MCKILISINPEHVEKIIAGIKKYEFHNGDKIKCLSLTEMNFFDLLEVAKAEKYIDKKIYQLGSYIKDCRNIVHPEREIKDNVIFDEEATITSWNIFKELIFKLV